MSQKNESLQREIQTLKDKISAVQTNGQTLSQTLNETQAELEALVNEHEQMDEMCKRTKNEVKFF